MQNLPDITEVATESAIAFKERMEVYARSSTHSNFHVETSARFTPCGTPARDPDFISNSGSKYWYEGDAVVRRSNHWGVVASCLWSYTGDSSEDCVSGICALSDFRRLRADLPKPSITKGHKLYKVVLYEKRKPVATLEVKSSGKFHVLQKVKSVLALIRQDFLDEIGLTLGCTVKFVE